MKVRPHMVVIFHVTPTTNGIFTIPAFQAMAYGKPVQVPAATLEVLPAGAAQPPTPPLLQATLPSGNGYVGQMVSIRWR